MYAEKIHYPAQLCATGGIAASAAYPGGIGCPLESVSKHFFDTLRRRPYEKGGGASFQRGLLLVPCGFLLCAAGFPSVSPSAFRRGLAGQVQSLQLPPVL